MDDDKNKQQFKRTAIILLAAVVIGFILGYILRGPTQSSLNQAEDKHRTTSTKWTCSMHPQIIQDEPGKCPLCGMDLIPLIVEMGQGLDINELTISEEAAKLMEIETSVVERKFVTADIRMVGTIDYDETRVKNITAWVPGRIDRLFVDFTGILVNKGEHMVELYSPQLISAQAELLQAVKSAQNIKPDSSELIKKSTLNTLEAAREKLGLLGLSADQIKDIENAGEPQTHLTIRSPISGIVIHKQAYQGMYVQTGTHIYTVAELSQVWAKLDAYESDLAWIKYGQQVEFKTEAYPGEIFKGVISFIDPVVGAKTRTVKLRVIVDNSNGKLKPNMFIRATVHSKIATGSKVMDPQMAGKWICTMHPSVVKDAPGSCDICGMDLVTTESQGYVSEQDISDKPLVIPASAPLITGKRAVVYVKKPQAEKPTFQARQILLGPKAENYYIVKSGLQEGEIVVTNGNFKIDSAMQIQAKPSMMNTDGEKAGGMHEHMH